ncbi:unnamed protein product [Pieris macdunnoughi]|uniref:Uncharacterized protein n=1 Tax=Pieris macdunnoughi TaxID=345717 RepID=A0A821L1L7_9NEOP|nr:unnamed protein product [Pieris macdunnoughi]
MGVRVEEEVPSILKKNSDVFKEGISTYKDHTVTIDLKMLKSKFLKAYPVAIKIDVEKEIGWLVHESEQRSIGQWATPVQQNLEKYDCVSHLAVGRVGHAPRICPAPFKTDESRQRLRQVEPDTARLHDTKCHPRTITPPAGALPELADVHPREERINMSKDDVNSITNYINVPHDYT